MNEQDDYVECVECGHPLERHTMLGCDYRHDGCTCPERWSRKDIRNARKLAGLPARFNPVEH